MMDRQEAATHAAHVLMNAADTAVNALQRQGIETQCIVLVVQVECDGGHVNAAVSWPQALKLDAAAIAREAAGVFYDQALGDG